MKKLPYHIFRHLDIIHKISALRVRKDSTVPKWKVIHLENIHRRVSFIASLTFRITATQTTDHLEPSKQSLNLMSVRDCYSYIYPFPYSYQLVPVHPGLYSAFLLSSY